MTWFTPEQFVVMQKANLDTAFGLARSAANGVEKLIALNLQVARAMLTSSQASLLKAVCEPQALDANAKQVESAAAIAQQAESYGRQLADLMSATVAEFVRAGEGQADVYHRRVETLVHDLAKNTPSGSEAAIIAWKSAITTSSAMIETIRKGCEHAAHSTESNFAAISGMPNGVRGTAK
jgi:phasin family protein